MRQPGSNTIEVTDAIKALFPGLPGATAAFACICGIRGDRSKIIREAFNDIQFTMAVTLALVILVIFLFLRNGSRHADPRPGAAVLHPRHLLGDGPAGFQPQQHVHDGADPFASASWWTTPS